MLPAKRASIGELWRKLTERSGRTSSHELNGYAAMPLRRDIQNGKIRKDK
jgi:phosphatidylinositol glycan class Q protein